MTSGKITANDIGKTVYLSNSTIMCQEWVIAGVNHEGTSGTVDLISKTTLTNNTTCFDANGVIYYIMGTIDNPTYSSTLDNYLEATVYNGFAAEVKNALAGREIGVYTHRALRHVVAPRAGELALDNDYTPYPLFGSSYIQHNDKARFNSPNGVVNVSYWTRSMVGMNYNDVLCIENCIATARSPYTERYVVACIRFAKA